MGNVRVKQARGVQASAVKSSEECFGTVVNKDPGQRYSHCEETDISCRRLLSQDVTRRGE